jgi:predicted SAM-dependent methyltransferase
MEPIHSGDETLAHDAPRHGLRLNLGSGWIYLEGFTNVDIETANGPRRPDIVADLSDWWLFAEDASVDYIWTSHTLEHIPDGPNKTPGIVWFMSEAWRVLKPGGVIDIVVPGFCAAFFRDPSHRHPCRVETFTIDMPVRAGWKCERAFEQDEDLNGEPLRVVYARLRKP